MTNECSASLNVLDAFALSFDAMDVDGDSSTRPRLLYDTPAADVYRDIVELDIFEGLAQLLHVCALLDKPSVFDEGHLLALIKLMATIEAAHKTVHICHDKVDHILRRVGVARPPERPTSS